ncbi:hypothetical protein [Metabacillus sp. FJAT-53654]|uniref:Helix-hairpin-helix domain-containing protein n=1 Tax=Metabacillus rhizosphaerae TaxID=3117747 RepID=A0ABZ2MYT6_9BACI
MMAKKRNPAIEKAEKEFYNKGCLFGFEQGVEVSRVASKMLFDQKLEELKGIKGIGPKTFEIIERHFEKYLEEVPDEFTKVV